MESYAAPAYLQNRYAKNVQDRVVLKGRAMASVIIIMFMITDDGICNYLKWIGSKARLQVLEYWLKQTDWFIKPYDLNDFFNNTSFTVILHINPKRIGHVALLLRFLKDEMLIDAAVGKGYLDVAAHHMRYHDKQIKAKRFSRISSEILNHPLDYYHIILPVLKIICMVKANHETP